MDPSRMYMVGLDYGTESGRALLVRVADGKEVATAVYAYGVIDRRLLGTERPLPPNWALQNPDDYLEVREWTVPAVLEEAGVLPEQVIGVAIDFTACTMLPALADSTPLCQPGEFRGSRMLGLGETGSTATGLAGAYLS